MVLVSVVGIAQPTEALSGISNPAPLKVAAPFILARAVEKTDALPTVIQPTLGKTEGSRLSLVRLGGSIVATSGFLRKSAIVARTPLTLALIGMIVAIVPMAGPR